MNRPPKPEPTADAANTPAMRLSAARRQRVPFDTDGEATTRALVAVFPSGAAV